MDIRSKADEMFDELGLQEQAEQDVRAYPNTPPPALVKSKISGCTEKKGREELAKLEEITRECEQTLPECKKIMRSLNAWPDTNKPTLDEAKRKADKAGAKLHRAEVNLKVFQEKNDLQRNVENDDRVEQVMVALVVIVGEGLLNSWFFKDAFPTGLAGGFLTAFIVSLMNVGMAFIGGVYGLRFLLNHNSTLKQIGGGFLFLLCIMICFFIISMTSLFRGNMDLLLAEKVLISDELNLQAWKNSLYQFLELDLFSLFATLGSFQVFFVGLFCAILGLWKGYEFDDPYPHYGPLWRTLQEAEEEDDEAKEALNIARLDDNLQKSNVQGKLQDMESNLSVNQKSIKRYYFDPSTEPRNYKLDENLKKLAFEVYTLYYQEMQKLVPTPENLPPSPDIDTWPNNAFDGFSERNFNKIEILDSINSDIDEVEKAVKELKKQ